MPDNVVRGHPLRHIPHFNLLIYSTVPVVFLFAVLTTSLGQEEPLWQSILISTPEPLSTSLSALLTLTSSSTLLSLSFGWLVCVQP